eukprot:SAG31_NODE_7533_length_1662_cov_1.431222_2_plen_394_part_00
MQSVINILCRNRHCCVRAPKFKDTRKLRQSPIYNGWTDDSEPHSPVSELFGKLVPFLRRLKKQRGALRYPPAPPYPEMKNCLDKVQVVAKPLQHAVGSNVCDDTSMRVSDLDTVKIGERWRAVLSDASCTCRQAAPVMRDEIFALAKQVHFNLGNCGAPESLPIDVEDMEEFEGVAETCADEDRLLIVDFHADWCGPCKQIAPIYRHFSVRFGTIAFFIKADIDENEALAERFSVKSVPTIVFLRGGSTQAHEKARIEGGGASVAPKFMEILQQIAKSSDLERLERWDAVARGPSFASAIAAEVTGDELKRLALRPLDNLRSHVSASTRADRGIENVDDKVEALDGVAAHDAASSAVAKSMLSRMIGDVAAYAEDANEKLESYRSWLGILSDS